MKFTLVLLTVLFSQTLDAKPLNPTPLFPATVQQQAKVIGLIQKMKFVNESEAARALSRPFVFAGKTKYAINNTMIMGCLGERIALDVCLELSDVPSLSGKIQKSWKNEFSIDVNSSEFFMTCTTVLYKGNEPDAGDRLELIQDGFDSSVKKAPFVFGSCTCDPTSLDAIGGDQCGVFGYESESNGN